jgi:hypothetical protein
LSQSRDAGTGVHDEENSKEILAVITIQIAADIKTHDPVKGL